MKRLLITIFIITFVPVASFSQVSKSVDEFTGQETIETEYFNLGVEEGDVINTRGMFVYSEQYLFVFATFSSEWQHLGQSTAYFLIDGERKEFETAHSESDMSDDLSNLRLTEINAFIFTQEDVESISNASSVRFKFGENIYSFSNSGIVYAQRLLDAVND